VEGERRRRPWRIRETTGDERLVLDGIGTLRAVLLTRSGSADRLELAEVPRPAPEPKEILVKVHAATVTRGDIVLRKLPFLLWRLFGFRRKTMLGHEFAGEIEAVGADVTLFKEGERVFGTTTGLTTGSYAEYICVPEEGVLATVPANISCEEAAPVPIGGLTALHLLREGDVGSGKRVLVYGASGSVGTFAVQLATHFGAHVTGVCSTSNVELVKSLGADEVVDYTKQDFTEAGQIYDIIFDAVGKASPRRGKRALAENGSYLSVRSSTKEKTEDLLVLRDLMEAGEVKGVIDRRYSLEQIPEAHRYVEKGHKRGNVVVTVGS
jgi:NADPH:quinone reductase-like Zn-dependent oxidoreductase